MDLRERAARINWYHTIELAPGLATEGIFDLRPWVRRYGLPDQLTGQRVLDVGSYDGFWAFEMERRGAAEVVALDLDDEAALDWPPRRRPAEFQGLLRGEGFRLAHEALDSRVARVVCSIYDADPQQLGTFDLVFCGMVLIHLRDQLLALEQIARLCHGRFVSCEEFDPLASLIPFPVARFRAERDAAVVFWQPSARAWRDMIRAAGFDRVKPHSRFKVRSNDGYSVRHLVHHASASTIAGRRRLDPAAGLPPQHVREATS